MPESVFITGLGILSPLGINLSEHVTALKEHRCGISWGEDLAGTFLKAYGFVPSFSPADFIENKKAIKVMDRQAVLGCAATTMALQDAGITKQMIDGWADDHAVVFGAGAWNGSITTMLDALLPCIEPQGEIDYEKLGREGYRQLPPLWILPRLPNTTAGQISIQNSIKGLNYSVVNGANNGTIAIGEAFLNVRNGRCARVICGSAEGCAYPDLFYELSERGFASESCQGSLPFDKNSQGFVCSEGSAILVLENEKAAGQRPAKVYGRILAYVNACAPRFSQNLTGEIVKAYEYSILNALEAAKIDRTRVDFIQAAACGVPQIDLAEALAIKNIFGNSVPVTSHHAFVGNSLSASGATAVAYALLQLAHDFVAPIIRTQEFFMDKDLGYVKNRAIAQENRHCLVNAFDYSGSACSLVLAKGAS